MSNQRFSVNLQIDGLAAAREKLEDFERDAMMTVSDTLRAVTMRMYGEILTRSPVDKGHYKNAWSPPDVREGENVVTLRMSNNAKHAVPVTYGSEAGKRPWPKAGPKTVKQSNRVYSRQAVGGVVAPVFEGWADDVVEEIANRVTRNL